MPDSVQSFFVQVQCTARIWSCGGNRVHLCTIMMISAMHGGLYAAVVAFFVRMSRQDFQSNAFEQDPAVTWRIVRCTAR